MHTNSAEKIYTKLMNLYGPQGWWPIININNNNNTNNRNDYHKNDYSYPKNGSQIFEICIGAILTQNTAWPNVEKSIRNLKNSNILSPESIISADTQIIKQCIRPAGYFNQKAKKLKIFSEFHLYLAGDIPSRQQLLNIWGIGPETADSILLYAYKIPTFVVDAYTRRILTELNIITKDETYDNIKLFFESNIKPDLETYQEFHALIVEHGKRHYSRNNNQDNCLLKTLSLHR